MDADLKKILKAVVLTMRHSLEGKYNETGIWQPGDLESRLAEIGVRQDRESVPAEEMPSLTLEDQQARRVVDGYLKLRQEAGVLRGEAVREFVRESAYTWANRLLALRCMEARELIDEAILQKSTYGGRSLEHHRLIQRNPELSETPDDGRFAMLNKVFTEQAKRLPNLFDPSSPSIALRPSPAALKQSLDWLSGSLAVRSQPAATDEVFQAPDALGWAYQYWNTDEKKRVFDMVKTVKGAKIAGADIVPATQLYTEDYMVKFLVQNSLGATWRGMYPESKLGKRIVRDGATEDDQTQKSVWEYYVEDADRVTVSKKPVREITLLDPACGSGHFLIEAFDMFYDMYVEEGVQSEPSAICLSILENNLFGIDIDLRAIQIAEVALWMKAAERVVEFDGAPTGLVAAVASHLKGESWERFLNENFIDEPSVPRVLRKFAHAMTNIDQLGTLARPAEELKEIIRVEHETWEKQQAAGRESNFLFSEMLDDVLAGQLPFKEMSDEQFGHRMMNRAIFAIDGFTQDARDRNEFDDALMAGEALRGFRLLQLLERSYDILVANPPFMGSKNMGEILRHHVDIHYKTAPTDLYTVFMLRCIALCKQDGRIAMIVPQTWMFLSTYAELRGGGSENDEEDKKGILFETSIEVLAQLGRHAFSEADPPSNCAMFVIEKSAAISSHSIIAYRLTQSLPSSEQDSLLKRSIAGELTNHRFKILQCSLQRIPLSPICYWVQDKFLDLFAEENYLRNIAECVVACKTSKNSRFVRQWWEVGLSRERWKGYEKESVGYRFRSSPQTCIDWSSGAQRFYERHYSAQLPNLEYRFRTGIVTSKIKRPNITARILEANALADMAVNQVFVRDDDVSLLESLCALLNSSVAVFLMRLLNPTVNCQPADFYRLPLTMFLDSQDDRACLSRIYSAGNMAISSVLSCSITRTEYVVEIPGKTGRQLSEIVSRQMEAIQQGNSSFDQTMCQLNTLIADRLQLNQEDLATIEYDITEPGLDDIEASQDGEDSIGDEDDSELQSGGKDLLETNLSALILLHLGWRWPSQDSKCEVHIDTSADGIIPLERLPSKRSLLERVEDHIEASEGINKELGCTLKEWLNSRFFSKHVVQFRKRPIVWQIRTKPQNGVRPVFEVFVFYHMIDNDTLLKIRSSEYLGNLRQRIDTELRGLVAASNAEDHHQVRREELEDALFELQCFDASVNNVLTSGFGPDSLLTKLRHGAISESVLVLKASWLNRLSTFISSKALSEWSRDAAGLNLDSRLPVWIANSVSNLSHHCTKLGIEIENYDDFVSDPTASELAGLVMSKCEEMLVGSMKCMCIEWWSVLDDTVFKEMKLRSKSIKDELQDLETEMESLKSQEDLCISKLSELKEAIKQVKSKSKAANAELKAKTAAAKQLRERIEAWRSDEPTKWGDWLAEQPMFDQISSLDDRRPPPKAIAEFIAQESMYVPNINDGVRVNIAPLQRAGILAADVLAPKDVDKAIADRAEWRADERRWVRQGILLRPGWWPERDEQTIEVAE